MMIITLIQIYRAYADGGASGDPAASQAEREEGEQGEGYINTNIIKYINKHVYIYIYIYVYT